MPPFNDTIFFIPYVSIPDHERPLGRDEDLQDLARRLQEAGQLVVVKGLGGIGKSTLARYYVDSHRHEYRHIAWVKVNSGLPAGFSQDTYLHGKLELDLSQIPHEYDRFTACLNALEKLEGPNLLVLDNAVQDAASQNYRSLLPKAPRWQVLLTSRHELNGYSKMELGKLSNNAARQLFERCYQKHVADETWKELYKLTDGHALSLELFGKSLHKTLGRLGAEGLVQRLKEKN
ncbi:MAG: ATP-binding protein [Saprospiraceae bacterium]|nr:ATP-binding protein [Saprospiraceae bacterium]